MTLRGAVSARRAGRRAVAVIALACTLLAGVAVPRAEAAFEPAKGDVPVLAYYYIWFQASSWNRAKTDYPALGRYSSDELLVMRRHVQWAKQAGIDGFIVSWKSTPTLDRRLERLIRVAEEEDFRLAIIYQGLDFERNPLPVERVSDDLDLFARKYAAAKPFQMFAKPLAIWSGTWRFTSEEITATASRVRDRVLLLASERNVTDFSRLAGAVDGNAYYWSSVNPETYPSFGKKLTDMAEAVHSAGGLWIAPAAPGFDARLIGGKTEVPRREGETLRQEWRAAMESSPDAVGIISWNEFSENSHVEPSQQHGSRYLRILRELTGTTASIVADFDSSAPEGRSGPRQLATTGWQTALILIVLAVITRRARSRRRQDVEESDE